LRRIKLWRRDKVLSNLACPPSPWRIGEGRWRLRWLAIVDGLTWRGYRGIDGKQIGGSDDRQDPG
jgi:hypothetical protein